MRPPVRPEGATPVPGAARAPMAAVAPSGTGLRLAAAHEQPPIARAPMPTETVPGNGQGPADPAHRRDRAGRAFPPLAADWNSMGGGIGETMGSVQKTLKDLIMPENRHPRVLVRGHGHAPLELSWSFTRPPRQTVRIVDDAGNTIWKKPSRPGPPLGR